MIFLIFFVSKSICQNTNAVAAPESYLFAQGYELLMYKKMAAAQSCFEQYMNQYPNSAKAIDAAYYQAKCILYTNKEQGKYLLENFCKKYPSHPKKFYANYDLACYYYNQKEYYKAVNYFTQTNLSQLGEDEKLEASFKLGYAYMNMKDFDKAGAAFNRVKSTKNKYTYAACYYLGYINYKNELYPEAVKYYTKAGENEAYKPLVPILIANVYNKQKNYDTLLTYLKKITKEDDNVKGIEELILLEAEAYFQKKQFETAAQKYAQNVEMGGNFDDMTKFKYAFCLYKTQKYDLSLPMLKSGAEKHDTVGQLSAYYLGMTYLAADNKPFACNSLLQAAKMTFIKDITEKSWIEYCKISTDLGQYAQIIDNAAPYLAANPNTKAASQLIALLSEAYFHSQDYLMAIKYIETLKTRDYYTNKTYQQAAFFYGLQLYNQNKISEALEYFDRALEYDFEKEISTMTYYMIAECLSMMKKYDDAIENYEKVAKNTNRISKEYIYLNYYGLATSYYNTKQYAKAISPYKEAANQLADNTKMCDAKMRLADCYYATKNYKEAFTYYELASKSACYDTDYCYFQQGITLKALGKYDQAQEALYKVFSTYTQSLYYEASIYNHALIDFENTKYQASIPHFSRVIDENKSDIYVPLALLKRAVAYNNLKKYDESIADYKTIVTKYTSHPAAKSAIMGIRDVLEHSNDAHTFDSLFTTYKATNPADSHVEQIEYDDIKSMYFAQNYTGCIPKIEAFMKTYPTSVHMPDLQYFGADAYLKTGDTAQAINHFDLIIENKKSAYLNRSILKLGEIYTDKKNYEKAISNYKLLLQSASTKKEVIYAWNGLMINYYPNKDYDSSSYYATQIHKQGAHSIVYMNRAWLYLAKNALAVQYELSEDMILACINNAEDVHGAEAMYLLSQKYYTEKKYKSSLEILFKLNTKYSAAYPELTGRSFLLIADNYLAMNETYQAKSTLSSIIENSPNKDLAQKAKEKLMSIEQKQ
ncbi:MAG: tetratricopeptide repeat protein [Cytophagales bacterium]|nr:tetratricopeptide repeat protein [Cytophagales bacterium]